MGPSFSIKSKVNNFLDPFCVSHPHFHEPYKPPGSFGHKEETSADSMSWTILQRREHMVTLEFTRLHPPQSLTAPQYSLLRAPHLISHPWSQSAFSLPPNLSLILLPFLEVFALSSSIHIPANNLLERRLVSLPEEEVS